MLKKIPAPQLDLAMLAAITLLGLAVRVYGLTDYGFWFDEGYHLQLVRLPSVAAMLEAVLSNPPSDPLYVLLLRGWTAVFGFSEAGARSLSVILGVATIPLTFRLGLLLAGRGAGLLAALFFALSPYAVEFGQEAALYGLAALTTTAALAAGWQLYRTGRGLVPFIVLGVLAIYSHYVVTAILVLFALLALLPWWGRRRVEVRSWLLAHAAIFLAWLPWLLGLIYFWLNSPLPRATLRNPATLSQVAGALVQYSSGTASLLSSERMLAILGLIQGVVLLGVGLLGAYKPARRGMWLIALIFGLLFLLPALVSALTGLWLFVPHFMLFLLPGMFVVLAVGIAEHATTARRGRFLQPIRVVAWLAIQLIGLALFYREPPHGADGLRELAAVINTQSQPGDRVFVTPPALTATLAQYYPGPITGLPSDFDLRAVYIPYEPEAWNATSLERLTQEAQGRFWLVYRAELDSGGEFLATVQQSYQQRLAQPYEYATLYLFSP